MSNGLHRGDDIGISSAPADVAAHRFFHISISWSPWLFHHGYRGHDLPGGAISALVAVMLHEGCLHRMQISRLSQAFDGLNLCSLMHGGKGKTAIHAAAVHMNSTSAALP